MNAILAREPAGTGATEAPARRPANVVRELFRHQRTVTAITAHLAVLDERHADVLAQWEEGIVGRAEARAATLEYLRRRRRLLAQLHRAYSAAADFLAGLPS